MAHLNAQKAKPLLDSRLVANRSLLYYWRIHLAVALGVAVGVAVLTGALLVGDSVRGSLRELTLERLGGIDVVLLSDLPFRAELASELQHDYQGGEPDEPGVLDLTAVPAFVFARATVENAAADAPWRSNQVTLVGSDERFWTFHPPSRPEKLPRGREIVLNRPLAERLHAQIGDMVTVRLGRATGLAADSTLADKDDLTRSLAQLKVVAIVPATGLGRFNLFVSQAEPMLAILPIDTVQNALDRPGQVNAVLVGDERIKEPLGRSAMDRLRQSVRPRLVDAGLNFKHVRRTYRPPETTEDRVAFEYYQLTTERMFFSESSESVLLESLQPFSVQPVLTYLANSIQRADRPEPAIPYSTVSALDNHPVLGPLVDDQRRVLPPLGDQEIALNRWAADDLRVTVGDQIKITYFLPETTHGDAQESSATFRLAAIVPLTEPVEPYRRDRPARYARPPTLANDPDLTPEVSGVTDQESIDAWDPPFPFDYRRIRQPKDEQYWDYYRTTPKAFLAKRSGERLWASRFGKTTSLRIPLGDNVSAEAIVSRIESAVAENVDRFGFVLLPVKADGLAAAAGTTPFGLLFLGFSLFIIAAALMLVALLFRLNVEQRVQEAGLLLAVGLRERQVVRLLLREGIGVALLGAVAGTLLALGYARLMIYGLTTWWVDAIVTPFLRFRPANTSIVVGGLAGLAVAVLTIFVSLRGLRHYSVRQLLQGQLDTSAQTLRTGKSQRRSRLMTAGCIVVAGLLAILGLQGTGEVQAGLFFGSGSLALLGLILALRANLLAQRRGATKRLTRLSQLALRNLARNPSRSLTTIALMGAACFLIIAISAFRLDPTDRGTGGFSLMAESDLPIFDDLNDPQVREDRFADRARLLSEVAILPWRLQEGDDASCRNLYRPRRPKLLGLTDAALADFRAQPSPRFAWAATADASVRSPWELLRLPATNARSDRPVPVVLDKNTAMYSLHLYGGVGETFSIDYGTVGEVKFQVVALLSNSILQGMLIVDERELIRLFPRVSGYRFFLIRSGHVDPAVADPDSSQPVAKLLEDAYSDQGLLTVPTRDRLRDLLAIQNTYLSTFQSLGGLGLVLGTLGLMAVQLRNVLQRRGELALLQATGYSTARISRLVLLEHLALLLLGLGVGTLAAAIAVAPRLWTAEAGIPYKTLAGVLGVILLVGLATGVATVRQVTRWPLVRSLRGE